MEKTQLEELLSKMSLEDKIAQLLQISGGYYEEDDMLTGPANLYSITEKVVYNLGSVINTIGARQTKSVQKRYLEHSNHKIPLLFMADIINGLKTIFPIPLGLACSFDMVLIKKTAETAAREAAVSGQHVTFSPMVDLVRDARWGRVLESSGEDTFLNCQYASAMVEGYQGESFDSGENIAACVKHFAAYGAAVAGREYNTVDMSERVLREDYLPAYKAAVDAGCEMVMTSFNVVDGIPASANKKLLKDILRGEWGFDKVIISDASAIQEIVAHGVAEDEKEAARLAIEASVDIDMMSPVYVNHLKELIEEGSISEQAIDKAVLRILELKNKFGLFEHPFGAADEEKEKQVILCKEHRTLAREAAAKACVLLKNEGFLPLGETKKIALIGPYADNKDLLGIWAVHGNREDTVTLKTAMEERLPKELLKTAKGSKIVEDTKRIQSFGSIFELEEDYSDKEVLQKEAMEAAKEADCIVLALGEHFLQGGEGGSRGDITIPEPQIQLYRSLKTLGKPIAVLLFNGRPLDLSAIEDADAVLECWFPGTEGGHGIADVLFGTVNPSGKLTMSFPYCTGQVPVYYNELKTGRPYKKEFENTRFGSKYTDIPNEPRYPFGYGLSYTTFTYHNLQLDKNQLNKRDCIHATVEVENTGAYDGEETVQLYIQDCVGSAARPVKELKGFQKVFLKKGEKKQIAFEIKEEMLRFYTASMEYKSEKGRFLIFVGTNSSDCIMCEFELKE